MSQYLFKPCFQKNTLNRQSTTQIIALFLRKFVLDSETQIPIVYKLKDQQHDGPHTNRRLNRRFLHQNHASPTIDEGGKPSQLEIFLQECSCFTVAACFFGSSGVFIKDLLIILDEFLCFRPSACHPYFESMMQLNLRFKTQVKKGFCASIV